MPLHELLITGFMEAPRRENLVDFCRSQGKLLDISHPNQDLKDGQDHLGEGRGRCVRSQKLRVGTS